MSASFVNRLLDKLSFSQAALDGNLAYIHLFLFAGGCLNAVNAKAWQKSRASIWNFESARGGLLFTMHVLPGSLSVARAF